MSDSAVAALSSATVLTGAEIFYIDTGAADKKVTATVVKNWTSTFPVLAAGTATQVPLTYTSGVINSTANAGSAEYDGKVFYQSPGAAARGVDITSFLARLHSVYTLTQTTAVQKLFNVAANGAVSLNTGAYFFDCSFSLSSTSATSGNGAFSIADGTGSAAAFMMFGTGNDGVTSTVVARNGAMAVTSTFAGNMFTATTTTGMQANITGTFEMTQAGTIIPSIKLTTSAAAIVAIGSFFRCYCVGDSTTSAIGNWS